jgi:methionyl-tRNA synthetase
MHEWKQWWFNPENVDLYQFMGKDNIYFHSVYWPSVQIGDGRNWTKVHHLSTTGKSAFATMWEAVCIHVTSQNT